jgi:hypothetical protein
MSHKSIMVNVKRDTKSLDINVRHSLALTGLDRHQMRVIREVLHRLNVLHNTHLEDNNFIAAAVVRRYIAAAMRRHLSVSTVDVTYPIRYIGARFRFDCPMLEAGMIAVNYRFKNVAQLQQLREGLQLPEWFIIPVSITAKSFY